MKLKSNLYSIIKALIIILILPKIFGLDEKLTYNEGSSELSEENPNIVQLKSGLGNQMFQYAFGKALENKLHRKVLFDNKWYKGRNKKNKKNHNHYALNLFSHLNISLANSNEIAKNKKNTVSEKKGFVYDEHLLDDNESGYYVGYFQNEKYFKNITEDLIREFKFPDIQKTDTYNQNLLKKIGSYENSVFIHIRRGDYLKKKRRVLRMTYYKNAITYAKRYIKDPHFFIICEYCKEFIEKEFKKNDAFEFIGETNSKNGEDWKDMVLMRACKNAIIANSTFSWWAAYLGRANSEGIVIAPVPWIIGGGKGDMIPKNWIRIKVLEKEKEERKEEK